MVNINLDNWNTLFESIQLLKLIVNEIDDKKCGFKSKGSEYIFYLTELEGKEQKDKLNVRRRLYSNRKLAKEWKNTIEKEITLEEVDSKIAQKAISNLNKLYKSMIAI